MNRFLSIILSLISIVSTNQAMDRALSKEQIVDLKPVSTRTDEHKKKFLMAQIDLIKQLVPNSTLVTSTDDSGLTLVMRAAQQNMADEIRELKQLGADILAPNQTWENFGSTALHYAAAKGCLEAITCLVKLGAYLETDNLIGTSLHVAAWNGQPEAVKLLTYLGANLEAHCRKDGYTPLHKAAQANKPEVIQCLVALGANINARAFDGKTPLHCAGLKNNQEAVLCLLQAGAIRNVLDADGQSAIDYTTDAIIRSYFSKKFS